jgi:ankyrin repeat protein
MIKFLVKNKVNPDKFNKNNNTPLHHACKLQLHSIIEYLLSENANPNFKDNFNCTSLHYLLSSHIKSVSNSDNYNNDNIIIDEIIDKKKYNIEENRKNIKEIKNELWQNLKNNDLLKLLSNTINNLI